MAEVYLRLARVERALFRGKEERLRVTFTIGSNPTFEIPMWLPQGQDEGTAIQDARARLHQFSLDLVETTKAWAAPPATSADDTHQDQPDPAA